jgi:Flp pilus assembly protein TadB
MRLIEVSNDDEEVLAVKDRLLKERTLMHVFYHFVDNDESLKDKAKDVRLNGLIWSSIADVIVISAVMLVLYVVGWFTLGRGHYLVMILVLVIAIIVGKVFLPKITRRHISLSDEQLEMIRLKYKPELRQKIHDVAKEMSRV